VVPFNLLTRRPLGAQLAQISPTFLD
jgi:hypothetical protein